MGFWRGAWRSMARPQLLEHVQLHDAADRATRRRARAAAVRGDEAPDLQSARLAVALARNLRHERRVVNTAWWAVGMATFVALIIFFAVSDVFDGEPVVRVLLVLAYVGILVSALRRRLMVRRAAETERRNREVLEEAGRPYEPAAAGLAVPTPAQRVVGVLLYVLLVWGIALLFWALAGDPVSWADPLPTVVGALIGMLAATTWASRRPVRV